MSRSLFSLGVSWLLGFASACAPTRVAAAPNHDVPVAANEPRALLKLELDLPVTASCEEDFDLKLYRNAGVDLIEWANGTLKCSGRRVSIRYLSRRTDPNKLLADVKALSQAARVVEP